MLALYKTVAICYHVVQSYTINENFKHLFQIPKQAILVTYTYLIAMHNKVSNKKIQSLKQNSLFIISLDQQPIYTHLIKDVLKISVINKIINLIF